MQKKYNSNRKIKINTGTIILLIIFLVVCVVGGILLYRVDHASQASGGTEKSVNPDVVEIGGVKCTPRANVETYLFMGVDAKGEAEVKNDYDGTGQSDVLILLIIDKTANTYAVLPINRDTITEVRSISEEGEDLGTSRIQIALAHANGDGMEQSCENTVEAVSGLLYGQKIDGYVSMNMDAIGTLNHLVGGVTVTIEDDFSKADSSLEKGRTLKLSDDQAVHFVHDRMNVGDGSNEGRMRRQNAYMTGLKEVFIEQSGENESFAMDVFNGLSDYMVTNLKGKNVSRISKAILKNKDLGQYEIKGTNAIDDLGFNAFTADSDSLAEIVVTLFYDRME